MIIPDWNGKPYHSPDYELKHTFGRKLYKLSLDGTAPAAAEAAFSAARVDPETLPRL